MKIYEHLKGSLKHWMKVAGARATNAWKILVATWMQLISLLKILRLIWEWLRSKISALLDILNHPITYSIFFTTLVFLLYAVIQPLIKLSLKDSNTTQRFIEWIGILYGLIISMLLVRSWERFEHIGELLAKEANALSNLFECIQLISTSVATETSIKTNKITLLIKDYIKHVDGQYEIECKDVVKESLGYQKIEAIKCEIKKMIIDNPNLNALGLEQKIKDVISARRKRLLDSRKHMPSSIWILLIIVTLLWLILFVSVNFENVWIHVIILGGLTFIVITITFTILFSYEPQNIRWNDSNGSWRKLKSKLQF